MLSLLEAALSYAARGWDVFPVHGVHKGRCTCGRYDCSSPGKHPLTSRGLHDATTNATVIAAWWRQWRRANVAIATGKASGMVVVDLDFPDALGSLDALIDGPCPLRVTLTALTGGGGVHLYYRWERELGNAAGKLPGCEREVPGVDLRADGGYQSTDEHFVRFVRGGEDPKSQRTELRNHTGRLPGHPEPLPGVDLRGEGGYVLAPPSAHVSSGRYEWLDAERRIAPAPEWLRQERAAPATIGALARASFSGDGSAYGLAVLNGELERLRSAGKGRRNHELNRAAFAVARVVAGGELLEAAARAALRAEALRIGLDEHETILTIESAFRAGSAHPRCAPHRVVT